MNDEAGAREASEERAERRFRLVVEYDGSAFEGWQIQAGARDARTVQGELLEAVERVSGTSARIRGAGRTDAGVHAWGQVASLGVATKLAPERLRGALNARLADDVAILDCREAPAGWDALQAAQAKRYRYQIWNGPVRSPLREGHWAWIREPLDRVAMASAAEAFVGRHDFKSMQAAGSSVKTTIRRVMRCEISGESAGAMALEVEGEGFLRHMVRNLAGTLIEIGRGRWAPERAAEILAVRDRRAAGPTAPAHGLALVCVWDDLCPRELASPSPSIEEARSPGGEGGGDGVGDRRIG